jgi:hypothetical protein
MNDINDPLNLRYKEADSNVAHVLIQGWWAAERGFMAQIDRKDGIPVVRPTSDITSAVGFLEEDLREKLHQFALEGSWPDSFPILIYIRTGGEITLDFRLPKIADTVAIDSNDTVILGEPSPGGVVTDVSGSQPITVTFELSGLKALQ